MDSLIHLSPREAFEYLKVNAAILDIRPEYETSYRVLDVPKVFFLPYGSYQDNLYKIPKDILIIVADSVGNRSSEVARYLLDQGYSQVACLAGGCACRLHPQKSK